MRKVISYVIVFMLGASIGLSSVVSANEKITAKIAANKDIYELWEGSGVAPLSVVFIKQCIRDDQNAAHLRLVSWSRAKAVIGCLQNDYTGGE